MNLPILAAVALALAACSREEAAPEPVRPVLTQIVTPGAAATRDTYSGDVRARTESDLAFRVGGKLVARPVDAGARVSRGQALARLDPEDAKLSATAARAQLATAESETALAKAERDRHADLLERKFISASAFDARETALSAARGRLEQARAQAALTANQSAYTTLVADADGVVVSVAAEPGQVVAAGQPVLRLAHSGEMDVVIHVPEGQLARFRAGDPARIALWAEPSAVFAGRIREIAGGADPVTRTYQVRVAALSPPAAVQLGMTANVALKPRADADLVLLPLGALAKSGTEPAVWIADPATGKVALRAVKVDQFREDGVTIASGLAPGEHVVIAGVHKLRPGQSVRLATPAPAGR